jgi:hypothetical protein
MSVRPAITGIFRLWTATSVICTIDISEHWFTQEIELIFDSTPTSYFGGSAKLLTILLALGAGNLVLTRMSKIMSSVWPSVRSGSVSSCN